MAGELDHRRRLLELGRRAVTYYVETGLCVFCAADDCAQPPIPHDECDVGELAGVVVDDARRAEKRSVRTLVEALVLGGVHHVD